MAVAQVKKKKKFKFWLMIFIPPSAMLIGMLAMVITVAALLAAIVAAVQGDEQQTASPVFSEAVMEYKDDIEAACRTYGLSQEWVLHIMAMMEFLTHGEGRDPMKTQTDEMINSGLANTYLNPDYSIKTGVKSILELIQQLGITTPDDDPKKLLLLYQAYYERDVHFIEKVNEAGGIDSYDTSGWTFANEVQNFIVSANMYKNVNGALLWPCPSSSYISSPYGGRDAPTAGASSNHKGIDIGAALGADIVSSAAGTVTTVAYNNARGHYIIVDHGKSVNGDNIKTLYQHCSKIYAAQGNKVEQGEVIAAVGSTGYSTGAHLHYEVLVNGVNVDPEEYLGQQLFEATNISGNGQGLKYTSEDLDLVSRLLWREAGASWATDELQRLVVSVVVNRVNSPLFPNTLREVIYQPGQYAPAINGQIDSAVPDARTRANAKYVLDNGPICPSNVLYQANFKQGSGVYKAIYDDILGTWSYFCYQ